MSFQKASKNKPHKPDSINSSMPPIGRFTTYTFMNNTYSCAIDVGSPISLQKSHH